MKKTLGERLGVELYTVEEVAEFLGMKPKTLYNKRVKGQGPKAVKIGGRVMYDFKDVQRYYESAEAA